MSERDRERGGERGDRESGGGDIRKLATANQKTPHLKKKAQTMAYFNNSNNNECISGAPFHVKHAQLR